MNSRLLLPAIAAVLALVLSACGGSTGGDPDAAPATRTDSHVLDQGPEGAPVLVEFIDFECEACRAVSPAIDDVRKAYDGKITFVMRHFPGPGHKNSMNAALAVEAAAAQGKMEEMVEVLLATQPGWGEKQDSRAADFRIFADNLGLDLEAYDASVADPAVKERIERDYQDGLDLGVTGTPTFFLDGDMLILRRLSDLTDPLDAAVAKAGL
ncbi:MAG: thioredoxin domain-containing protein [Mobilicoccus sp.]|nr:thioredoxin domain-containing protein [Mobilicoccus sp.]